jgi:hypothetical protein
MSLTQPPPPANRLVRRVDVPLIAGLVLVGVVLGLGGGLLLGGLVTGGRGSITATSAMNDGVIPISQAGTYSYSLTWPDCKKPTNAFWLENESGVHEPPLRLPDYARQVLPPNGSKGAVTGEVYLAPDNWKGALRYLGEIQECAWSVTLTGSSVGTSDVQAWATIWAAAATAAATFAVAVVAFFTLRANSQLVTETGEAVKAATREANASERLAQEAERDRELNWQPLIRYADDQGVAKLFNDGRGPAYRAFVAQRYPPNGGDVLSSSLMSVGAGKYGLVRATPPVAKPPRYLLPPDVEWAAYCEDQFGNRYQFLDKGERPEVWHGENEPQDKPKPMWLESWRYATT